MKLKDFGKESLVLIKNYGVNKIGRITSSVGVGMLGSVALSQVIPSWKSQTPFDEKYKKIVSIAGLTAAFGGLLAEDLSEHKQCIAACKGTFSNEYLAELDRLPKK
jgi:hypothetical protein